MEVTSNSSFRAPQDAKFFCNSATVIFWDFFCLILLAVRGGKINMVPLPGKFVMVPVALNFLRIVLMVNMGLQANRLFFPDL